MGCAGMCYFIFYILVTELLAELATELLAELASELLAELVTESLAERITELVVEYKSVLVFNKHENLFSDQLTSYCF